MTDRKPLEELFDFPTNSEPGPPPADRGRVEPGRVPAHGESDRDVVAQQDLLFDEADGSPSPESGPTELFDDPADEPVWPTAPEPAEDAAAGEVTLADRWLSGAADALLLLSVLCVALLSMLPLGLVPGRGQWPGLALFLGSFSFMYCTFPLAFWGQTPGMAWRGLRAINDDGLSLSFSQTTLRWVGGGATLLLLGLPLVVALSGRSVADRLSGSWTVRA